MHSVYLDLVGFLLSDFDLVCTNVVEKELGHDNLPSLRLKALLADRSIKKAKPKSAKIKLYGDGERAATNLALERKLLLLIDDWRPYEAAPAAGVEVVNSLVYLVVLYEQKTDHSRVGITCIRQGNAPRNFETRMDTVCGEDRICPVFFNETKSSQQLSRFRLWDSRSKRIRWLLLKNGRHICPRINATRLIHILGTP